MPHESIQDLFEHRILHACPNTAPDPTPHTWPDALAAYPTPHVDVRMPCLTQLLTHIAKASQIPHNPHACPKAMDEHPNNMHFNQMTGTATPAHNMPRHVAPALTYACMHGLMHAHALMPKQAHVQRMHTIKTCAH
eukprot:351829-Chlamydomonas_euryale.AAC.4